MLDAESRNGRTEKHDERRSMKKLERLGDDARPAAHNKYNTFSGLCRAAASLPFSLPLQRFVK